MRFGGETARLGRPPAPRRRGPAPRLLRRRAAGVRAPAGRRVVPHFQRQVWAAVYARSRTGAPRRTRRSPPRVGRPDACRAVGAANGRNPLPGDRPVPPDRSAPRAGSRATAAGSIASAPCSTWSRRGLGSIPWTRGSLQSIPLFESLSRDERGVIAQHADEIDVAEGTELVRQGEFAYEFFVIEDGRRRGASRRRPHRRPRPRRLPRRDGDRRQGRAQRDGHDDIADSKVIVMTEQAFRSVARSKPDVASRIAGRRRGTLPRPR